MANHRHYQTKAIILKKHNFNEADYQITIYSPELGKINAIAKGARKINSSFTGHLQTLNICSFQLYKNSERFTITQCQVEKSFKNIRKDLKSSIGAMLILEIFEKSIYANEEQDQKLFRLLTDTLQILNSSEQHFLAIESFKFKLLHLLGALPDLAHCFSCTKRWQLNSEIWLDNNGQLSCDQCKNKLNLENNKIDFNMIKLLNFLLNPKDLNGKKILLNSLEQKKLKSISKFFLYHYLNHELGSEKIITQFEPALLH